MTTSIPILSSRQVNLLYKQRGFILLAVVLTLSVLAAMAFMLSRQGSIAAGGVKREHQPDAARYVAEAGYNHAVWQLNRQNCAGYSDIPATSLGSDSYTATIIDSSGAPLTAGSPATISAVGTLANGISFTRTRSDVKIYQFPLQKLLLQPDATKGKDSYLYLWKNTWNYGSSTSLSVSNKWLDSLAYSLFSFDLSNIPSEAKIVSAVFELWQNSPSSNGGTVAVRRILSNWIEGSADGANGVANWNDRQMGVAWTTSGGDFTPTTLATTDIPAAVLGWYQWDITALISDWVHGVQVNRGFALTPESANTHVYFNSSDSTDPTLRPKLTITYACECGKTCGAATPPAKKIYWTDDNAQLIQRADEDGANVETVISGQYKVRGLDIDTVNGKIYWSSDTFIKRANLDGSNLETIYTTSKLNFDVKLDVAGGKMYWTYDNPDVEVMRANLDGGNVQIINSALTQPMYFSLDQAAGYIYLSDYSSGVIERLNLDGTGRTTLVGAAGPAMGSAVDAIHGKIYWSSGSNGDWIKRANLDGSNVQTIVTGQNSPQDIAYDADNDRIYWTEALVTPSIHRANVDGTNMVTIVSGLTRPRGIIIVNADLVPPTGGTPPPANCNGTFLDQFNSISFANNDGSLSWSGGWLESNEADGANKGDVSVLNDNGPYQLQLKNKNKGIERQADLTGAVSATLSFLYHRSALDVSSDYVVMQISANGSAGPWTEIARFQGPGTDTTYQSFSQDISTYISAATRIRLLTSPSLGKKDAVLFDDIQIQCSP